MAKVITFSRKHPSYHPKKGLPTYFIEKFLRSVYGENPTESLEEILWNANGGELNKQLVFDLYFSLDWSIQHIPKGHTVRAGHRFKAGDKFSPRVWSGLPYRSQQVILGPDIEIKNIWDFECHTEADDRESDWSFIKFLDNQFTCYSNEYLHEIIKKLALNDGFSDPQDFLNWVQPSNRNSKPLLGQVICWSNKIEYP